MTTTGDEYIARVRKEQDQLYAKLTACPLVEIEGVMSPRGAGSSQSQGETYWTLKFELDSWRFNGGLIEKRPLTVLRRVNIPEREAFQDKLSNLGTVRIRARFRRLPGQDTFNALLEEVLGPSEDPDLIVAAEKLQRPVTYDDTLLGTFMLDRRSGSFDGKATWASHPIDVVADTEDSGRLEPLLGTVRQLLARQAEWDRRAKEYAAEKLQAIKNKAWLDDDQPPATVEDFVNQMSLESVTVSEAGKFTLWFADGDLFWGHSIRVTCSLEDGPSDASIEG